MATKKVINMKELNAANLTTSQQQIPLAKIYDKQKESINIDNPKANRKFYESKGWDKDIPEKEYFDEIFRISKNQIIW